MKGRFPTWRPPLRITPDSFDNIPPPNHSRLLRDKQLQGCTEFEPSPRCYPPSLLTTNSPGKTLTPGPDCLDGIGCSRGYSEYAPHHPLIPPLYSKPGSSEKTPPPNYSYFGHHKRFRCCLRPWPLRFCLLGFELFPGSSGKTLSPG